MLPGQTLVSANGQYRFAVQRDGNLVVYGRANPTVGSNVVWAANRCCTSDAPPPPGSCRGACNLRLTMQGDGNLVM